MGEQLIEKKKSDWKTKIMRCSRYFMPFLVVFITETAYLGRNDTIMAMMIGAFALSTYYVYKNLFE